MDLRSWRLARELTLAELSEEWAIPLVSLSNWERGKYVPRLADVCRIMELTDNAVGPHDFLRVSQEWQAGSRVMND